MDSEGNIYLFGNHPNPSKFIEDYNLVEIPKEEYATVVNMDQRQKRAWYKSQKALEGVV